MFWPVVSSSSRIVVLDCGAGHTSLGVWKRCGAQWSLEQYAARAFEPDRAGEDHWLENSAAAFRALRAQLKVRGPVALVLPGHVTLVKSIRIPRVAPAQRDKLIRFEAAQAIPYPLAEVAWGGVAMDETADEMELLLVAAKLEVVEPLCAAAEQAGFAPRFILPSTWTTLTAFRSVQIKQEGSSLVINLGARSTTVWLVEAQRFAVRMLAPGSVDFDLPAGDAKNSTAETPVTHWQQEIVRTVLQFRWRSAMPAPSQVWLTGGGSPLPGVGEGLAAKLKLPADRVRSLSLDGIVAQSGNSDSRTGDALLIDSFGAATALLASRNSAASETGCLPLKATNPGDAPDRGSALLDLMPESRRTGDVGRGRRRWLAAAAVVATLILLPPLVRYEGWRQEMQKQTAAIEHELAPLRMREARMREKVRQIEEITQQKTMLQEWRHRRGAWMAFLSDLQNRLEWVDEVWFDRLQWVTEPATGPLKLAVSGRMLDRTNSAEKAAQTAVRKIKAVLASLVESPFVTAVEGERFDGSQPGVLRFDFVLVGDPQEPL